MIDVSFYLLIDMPMNLLLVLRTKTFSVTYIYLCVPTIFYSVAPFTPPPLWGSSS